MSPATSRPKIALQPGEEKLARYVYFDPGEMYGWAAFNAIGEIVGMGQFHFSDDVKTLDSIITEHVVFVGIEDYRNYKFVNGKRYEQKAWSRNQTSKNIGKIETICELKDIKFELLQSGNKATGYMMMGRKPPKNHAISHEWDAAAHGFNDLVTHGIRNPIANIPESER